MSENSHLQANTFKAMADYLNSSVLVKMKGNREVKGILTSYDQHLNLILEKAEELEGKVSRPLGLVLLRGDNVIAVSPAG
ncbi:small nuclear ribonucleoprotein [Caldisphaera lagunensis DSM 15908]|uniref:Putative snRNP Sm-like protein n=1 Tax=Caldisphaera lagunensis (strain DSM 15908 / JCM 11604 / ANMR 0165 / IC-154) TaxID=1056495 RepID=L0A8I5_CALLD|nr:LSm family protein [Caldisphaera lagunensis]AFZ70136.1 small nuclear ribonucleoprotein [Caldisphaera lagunensis DSM 15908]